MDEIRIIPTETRYQRRRGSKFGRFLAQLIFLLASLIPMCIIAWRIDLVPLHGPPQQVVVQQPVQPSPPPRIFRTAEPHRLPDLPEKPHEIPPTQDPNHPTLPAPNSEVAEGPETIPPAKPLQGTKQTIIPFDLKKRFIRVVSIPEDVPLREVLCDIEGSANLGFDPLIKLAAGANNTVLFQSGISGVVVGAQIEFRTQARAVVLEIHPKYRLPSGDEDALYQVSGTKKAKQLMKDVALATEAQQALPNMRSELSRIKSQYQEAPRIANTPTTPEGYLRQAAAQRAAAQLERQGKVLENQIANAESLAAQLPQLQADLAAIEKLGVWSAQIAESATISVRFHYNGRFLIAEAK